MAYFYGNVDFYDSLYELKFKLQVLKHVICVLKQNSTESSVYNKC